MFRVKVVTDVGTNHHFEKASKVEVTESRKPQFEDIGGMRFSKCQLNPDIMGQYQTLQFQAPRIGTWTDKGIAPEYGYFIGRFQPFHIAHEAIIHEIIADGKIPMVIIGGTNKVDMRHPISPNGVSQIISLIFPNINTKYLPDYNSWDVWYNELLCAIEGYSGLSNDFKPRGTFYINNKSQDRTKFKFRGVEIDGHYSDIFKLLGLKTKEVTYPKDLFGIKSEYALGIRKPIVNDIIHSSDIRKNIEANKKYLDGRVYKYLKDLGW